VADLEEAEPAPATVNHLCIHTVTYCHQIALF